ncbi:RCC1 domain-containing protein [Sorangium sp. So ce1000]|uniref:RCC1 domain-containing protein n=1 Tax=Sorangium sp. So ce1000 TaxID=3133325 RepID=UPI003F633037
MRTLKIPAVMLGTWLAAASAGCENGAEEPKPGPTDPSTTSGGGHGGEGQGGEGGQGGDGAGGGGQGGDGGQGGAGGHGGDGAGGHGGGEPSTFCQPDALASCYTGPAGTQGVGACAAGFMICDALGSGYGPCTGEVLPSAEACGTITDDDCDGQVNEEDAGCACVPGSAQPCYGGPAGTEGVGACHAGTQTCNALGTGYEACTGEVLPSVETCTSAADDDCDGQANEEGAGCVCVPGSTVPCYQGPAGTEGVGVCHAGVRTCNAQGTGYGWCTGQRVPDEVEWCASPQDENCDGLVNPACAPVTLAAGSAHSLAVRSDGTIWGWGDNGDYQVSVYQKAGVYGDPFFVQELSGVTDVAAGYGHSLALLADGTVRAWGTNYGGQLGTTTTIPDLVVVPGLDKVIDVAAGRYHSMALRSDGTVWTWGDSSSGQLGDGTVGWRATPAPVPGLSNVVAIAAGDIHALAVLADGTVWAWGEGSQGQLGDGASADSAVPVQVSGLDGAIAVAAGTWHSLALRSDGTVRAWGEGSEGQLGQGVAADSAVPVPVAGLDAVTAIAAGMGHSLALRSDGTARAWGSNGSGQLGNPGYSWSQPHPTPVPVLLDQITAIAAGDMYALALRADGTRWAWGDNDSGQLGNHYTGSSVGVPVEVWPYW